VLVDFQRVHGPVRIFEIVGVVLDVVYACVGFRSARSRIPDVASPVATEGVCENDLHFLESLGDVAVSLEDCHWLSPARRVRRSARDVRGDRATWEKEDVDERGCDFGGVDAAVVVVETFPVAPGILGRDLTSLIVALSRSIDIAIIGRDTSKHVA
jgi:hypothetical protein